MFMDISFEMIHALLPIYMITVLGASVMAVGFIEGIAEATASFMKFFSGAMSDRFGHRNKLAVLRYGLAALVADVAPIQCRGTTFGVYHLVNQYGIALLKYWCRDTLGVFWLCHYIYSRCIL